ncbi:MAG: hypothetical protein J6Z31_03580 [Fibrobacter sp.]|nr:hypothetical protein [Fibrobacter sp.]
MRQTILFFLLFTVGLFADELAAKDSTVNTPQNIEQAILAEPLPASEMVRRGRAYLLKSLLNGDREQAVQTIEYLNSAFSEMLCPFSGMEKGLAYLHADRYDSALTALIQARRLSAPKAKRAVSFEDRCVVESQNDRFRSKRIIFDELYAYLEKDYPKTAAQIDSLVSEIQNSSVDSFYKDEARAFVPVIFTASFGRAEAPMVQKVCDAGNAFVQKYPANEDGVWLEANFVKPLQKRISRSPEDSPEDPIKSHLYTSGVGFEFLSGMGMLTGDLKDEFHHKYLSYYAAIPIQLYRVVFTPFLSFGTLETRNNRRFEDVLWEENSDLSVYSAGITLGFVLFDSRYVKFEPFVGIGSAESMLPDDSNDYYYYANKSYNNYHRLKRYVKHENSVEYLLGVTGELRLWTLASRNPRAPLSSISLRGKYMAQFIDHDFGYKSMEGVSHKILLGVGFFIW